MGSKFSLATSCWPSLSHPHAPPCAAQVPAPDAIFDYVMGDVMVTLVIELMATPAQVCA